MQSRFGTTQATVSFSRANSVNAPLPSVSGFDGALKKYNYSFKHRVNSASGLYGQLETTGQSATKPLLSSERIAFGGSAFGKGFPPSSIVGDRGYGNSLEIGWSTQMSGPFSVPGQVQFFAFRDLARAEQISTEAHTENHM